MPQIMVWQCPSTKKLFIEQAEYKTHLAKLARERRKVKHHNYIKSTFFEWLDEERLKMDSIGDMSQWLLDNQQTIMDAANLIPCGNWSDDKFHDTDRFLKIDFTSLRWNPSISNTHSCPKGGVTNWAGKELFANGLPKPNGYPGWGGRLEGSLKRLKKHDNNYPSSGFFKLVGLHTGTGGGGNTNFGWDVKIFAEEWPGPAAEMTFNKLKATV
jgi:hypothetical protein